MHPTPSAAEPPVLELRGVTKIYTEGTEDSGPVGDDAGASGAAGGARRHVVLDDVDLAIGRGEKVALLGRSGSGKSTLLNLFSGIDLATGGEVLFEGRDLGLLSETERTLVRRRRVGFVFQFFNLIPTLTVEENLLLPLELAGRLDAAAEQRALDLLGDIGLADRRGSFPDVLSGGEQQRVAIARALVHEPAVLLADEPTGNLDEETAARVLEVLDRALEASGRTLVMATHSREIAGMADRVLRVHGGRLEAAGAPGVART